MRKVILYIACSLDGYIAKPGDDLSFLEAVAKKGEDYGYATFSESVDTIIMGRRTYEWVMSQVEEFPHQDKKTYIITRELRESIGNVQFYSDDIAALIERLRAKPGKNIFIDGGAQVVKMMLHAGVLNEMIISIIPVVVGAGIPLFVKGIPESKLSLLSSKSFESGLVQLHYSFR
ncbi:dihydrofolate reductase family protein [Belliella pelovolcani]|uniref:Dihydrofolate reductase n=1 Tax=Belliella pelovolcani TaxID=529505 RepID=A0A1N7NVW8_9BACT|nr:dihydrofolate reductase family protein [Belliella pelovolcani]SIT02467.1 dihydrofolate reductase [Belliella pelovolcani]